MAERVDLEHAEWVINRPHIIELRDDGWTVMHPPRCHPNLFACPVSRAATRDLKGAPKPSEMGEFFCDLRPNGRLRIGERAPDSEGIDWAALVAELRVDRRLLELLVGAEPVDDQGCIYCHEGPWPEPADPEKYPHVAECPWLQAVNEVALVRAVHTIRDIDSIGRPDPAAGHADPEGPP